MSSKLDRRDSPRITDSFPIRVMLPRADVVEEDETYTINVSSGGIFFSSRIDLKEGDTVYLNIIPLSVPLLEYGMVIKATATILRTVREKVDIPITYAAARFKSAPTVAKI